MLRRFKSKTVIITGAGGGIGRQLALDYVNEGATVQEGIRCNAIAPGGVETELVEESEYDSIFGRQRFIDGIGRGRYAMGQPQDISNLVRFVSSDEASCINGSVLVIDGGMLSF